VTCDDTQTAVLIEYVDLFTSIVLYSNVFPMEPQKDTIVCTTMLTAIRKFGTGKAELKSILIELSDIRKEYFEARKESLPAVPEKHDRVYTVIMQRAKLVGLFLYTSTHIHTKHNFMPQVRHSKSAYYLTVHVWLGVVPVCISIWSLKSYFFCSFPRTPAPR